MQITKIKPIERFDISELLSAGEVVAFNATQDKNIILVVATRELDYRETNNGGASFAKIKTTKGQNYSIHYSLDNTILKLTDIENEPYNIHDIQFLGHEKVLLICSRSARRTSEDFDKNGRIYATSGSYVDEILLGDGIESTQVTNSGIIWTSYFDEGIFGNYGWIEPIGVSGLLAWQDDGSQTYEFQPIDGLDRIFDCYALNVENNDITWCYYYTEFPLVKIKSGIIVDYWQIPISGSHVFSIENDLALFGGGYEERDVWSLIRLKKNRTAEVERRFKFIMSEEIKRVVARGDTIFMLAGTKIYTLSVSDCLNKG